MDNIDSAEELSDLEFDTIKDNDNMNLLSLIKNEQFSHNNANSSTLLKTTRKGPTLLLNDNFMNAGLFEDKRREGIKKLIKEGKKKSDFININSDNSTIYNDIIDHDTEKESYDEDPVKEPNSSLMKGNKRKLGGSFQSMGLFPPIFKGLMKKGYKLPTPIQRKVIPLIMADVDVVAMAKTGSGKTGAFVIPLLHKLKTHSAKVGARALILAPSRELATQSLVYIKTLSKYIDLRAVALLGGDNMNDQFDALLSNPDIIVATPGRLIHIIEETKMDLRSIQVVIFDEADRLFEMGLATQIHEICSILPENRQTCLFSATLPLSLMEFAKAGLKDPQLVRLDVDSQLSSDLESYFFSIKTNEKEAMLLTLLTSPQSPIYASLHETSQNNEKEFEKEKDFLGGGIIFVSTRHHVEYLHLLLELCSISHQYLYGSMDPEARRSALTSFRNRESPILIVTDVAARGLDLPYLHWVLHYDFPAKEKLFIHRAGRVARAGRPGKALSIVTPDEMPYLYDLSVYLGRNIISTDAGFSTADLYQDIVIGTAPRNLLDDQLERWQNLLSLSTDLDSLKKVTLNALKLYVKTRPSASSSAYEKAKVLLNDTNAIIHIHPTWTNVDDVRERNSATVSELTRNDLLHQIQKYRPSETIFEAMKKNTKGEKTDDLIALMAKRRDLMSKMKEKQKNQLIKFTNQKEESTTSLEEDVNISSNLPLFSPTVYESKEKDFYMSYEKSSHPREKALLVNQFATEAKEAVLDLSVDDTETLRSNKRNRQVWDTKKKNFVTAKFPSNERNKRSLQNGVSFFGDNNKEDRKFASKGNTGQQKSKMKLGDFYRQWQKKRRIDLPNRGSTEVGSNELAPKRTDYRNKKKKTKLKIDDKKKGDRNSNEIMASSLKKNQHKQYSAKRQGMARNELKRPEQVIKERKRKVKETERLSRKKKPKLDHSNFRKKKK